MNRRIVIALATGAMLLGGRPRPPRRKRIVKRRCTCISRTWIMAATKKPLRSTRVKRPSCAKRRTPIASWLSSIGAALRPKAQEAYENVAKHCEKLAQYYENDRERKPKALRLN